MQQLFNEVVNQFQSIHQYDKFVKQASKEYDIKIYRLHSFTLEHACIVYNELYQKYQDKLLARIPCGWHENQRRVYVWFIVCYIHYKLLDPIKLVDNQKHWKHISHTFWDKDINFLKYQLHTILKTRGRTVWKTFQDELLMKIYPKHPKGQWNEIAKEFYFQLEGKSFKTPKQCRQRWQNHLNDDIKRGQWTPAEDYILLQEARKNKKKWARIIPLLKNTRTEHMIKNRYKALLNKAMQDKNMSQDQAIDAILAKKLQQVPQQEKSFRIEVQLKKHEITKIQDREIQFVQSEQIISESVEIKKDTESKEKRKRGRPKNTQLNSIQNSKVKVQPIRPDVNLAKNSHLKRIGEIDGCQMIGPDTSRFQHFIFNSQRSDSFFGAQSNSFFKSHLPNGLYDSGNYSMNSLKFPCDDRSFSGLQQFALKQDRSGKFEKKKPQDNCMREIQSIRIRPNQSFISRFMNP